MIRWKRLRMALALGLTACLAANLLPGASAAASRLDPTLGGSLTFQVGDDFKDDLDGAEMEVDIYKIASVDADAVYTAVGDFENDEEIALALTTLVKPENLSGMTSLLMKKIYSAPEDTSAAPGSAEPDFEELKREIEPDATATLSVRGGKIDIDPGDLGLYLVIPHKVQTKIYEYTFSPLLLPVPALGTKSEAESIRPMPTPDPDAPPAAEEQEDWQYDYTVHLKLERDRLTTEFEIEKVLLHYNVSLGPVTFVFEIEIEEPAEGTTPGRTYKRYASITFDGTKFSDRVTVTGIPVGSKVTVHEVYRGGGAYKLVEPVSNSIVINEIKYVDVGDTPESVQFTNDTDGLVPGVGAENHYVKVNTVNGKVTWRFDGENSELQGGGVGY